MGKASSSDIERNKKNKAIALELADEKRLISIENAKKLPGFLGKIIPIQLELYGWYAYRNGEKNIFYELG